MGQKNLVVIKFVAIQNTKRLTNYKQNFSERMGYIDI